MANLYNTFDQINASVSGVSNYFDFTSTGASLTGANIILDATNITIDGSTAITLTSDSTVLNNTSLIEINAGSDITLTSDSTVLNNTNLIEINGGSAIELNATNISINGDVLFVGSGITAPYQTMNSDESVLTREWGQKYNLFALSEVRSLYPFTGNTSGAGTALFSSSENLGFSIQGSTTASAWQRIGITKSWTNNTSASGGFNNATVPVAFSLCFFPVMEAAARSEIRFVVGDAGSGAPNVYGANAITSRGFGAIMYYDTAFKIKLFSHNGTTYTASSPVTIDYTGGNTSRMTNLILTSDGAGNIKLFWGMAANDNGTPVAASTTALITHTGGPTSGNYGGQYFSVLNVNNSTPPTAQTQVRGLNCMVHVGAIY